MNTPHIFAIPTLILFFAVPTWAAHNGHAGHSSAGSEPQNMTTSIYSAKGKVAQIEKSVGKIIIDHDPVTALNWPRMTMGFEAESPSLLDGLKKGDAVRFDFRPENAGGHVPVIVDIEVLK
jgi:Cu(I)/Ag(I) efflux system protein CusF